MRAPDVDRPPSAAYIGIRLNMDNPGLNLSAPRRAVLKMGAKGQSVSQCLNSIRHAMRLPAMARLRPVPAPAQAGSRRCMVKVAYTRGAGIALLEENQAKIAYISRKEATLGKEGEPAKPAYEIADDSKRLYTWTAGGRRMQVGNSEAVSMMGDSPVFRVILSPEDSGVDLAELARRFVQQSFFSARGTCRSTPLWVAANHYNTGHPHVHLIISRTCLDGSLLRIPEGYVREGVAAGDAGAILEAMKGPRSLAEASQAMAAMESQPEFNRLDREIRRRSIPAPAGMGAGWLLPDAAMDDVLSGRRSMISRRLSSLGAMKLASRHETGWLLCPDWERQLRGMRKKKELGLEGRSVILDGADTKDYQGTVTGYAVDDDHSQTVALSVLDDEGRTHVLTERFDEDALEGLKGSRVSVGPDPRGGGRPAVVRNKDLLCRKRREGRMHAAD